MVACAATVLLYLASLTVGLSLDHLSSRLDFPALHSFTDPYDHSDGDYDLVPRTTTSKRKTDRMSDDYEPSIFSKGRNDRDFWEKTYPALENFRDQVKRETKDSGKDKQNQKELADILKDDETEKPDKKVPPSAKRQEPTSKKKRESLENELPPLKDRKHDDADQENPDFQDWLRREYYRNMAKSFASMRKKRAMWGPMEPEEREERSVAPPARALAGRQKKEVRFEEVTDNLKAIEDALLADALQVIKGSGGDYEDKQKIKHRVTNDLNAAYDIETMRAALFRLQDTLYSMEEEKEVDSKQFSMSYKKHKRGEECPPLNVLTSDCAALSDIVPDDSLKELLTHACNWHEVCYSCGDVFGLSSNNCDMGFVEQSRTICRGDVPCESTARLLLLPLRQRRVFFKRSNPSVCLVDPCVEDFLLHG